MPAIALCKEGGDLNHRISVKATVAVIASRKRCGDLNEFTLFLFTKIASSDVGIETQDYFYDGYSQSGKALRDAVPFAVHLRNYLKRSCAELKVHFQFFHLYTLFPFEIFLFPTRVGVILCDLQIDFDPRTFPHIRGGDPTSGCKQSCDDAFSPHTWG